MVQEDAAAPSPQSSPYIEDVESDIQCYLHAEVFGARSTPEGELEEEVCAMCTEPIRFGDAVVRLPCTHVFHRCELQQVSILDWLRCHPSCPICETPVMP